MGRRFLQGFQQGVESAGGKHVHLVDDINPVFRHGRGEIDLLPQIPDVVHAVVGGGVDFHHIHDGARVDPPADLAFVAGIPLPGLQAVDRLGQNLGAGSLAGAPGAGEQVGVGQPSGAQLVPQGGGHLILAVNVGKGLRPPLAIKHLVQGCPTFPSTLYRIKRASNRTPHPLGHTDGQVTCGAR